MSTVRAVHRWVSLAFAVLVAANLGANLTGWSGAQAVGMVTLVPLLVLLATGMLMFVAPYRHATEG